MTGPRPPAGPSTTTTVLRAIGTGVAVIALILLGALAYSGHLAAFVRGGW